MFQMRMFQIQKISYLPIWQQYFSMTFGSTNFLIIIDINTVNNNNKHDLIILKSTDSLLVLTLIMKIKNSNACVYDTHFI